MNWLTNFIRPRIRSLVEPKDVPDNLWQKCPGCEGMLFNRDLQEKMNVCYHCGHHLRISVKERLAIMFDDGRYDSIPLPDVPQDPLKFKDKKKYADRLKDTRSKTGHKDAITIAKGKMGGIPVVIAAFNFSFMGGSMGAAVGEGILRAAEEAVKTGAALITIPASGGARMQEGIISLVQMPRSIIAVEMVKEAGLPYIVLLTDPTTGGVSASFAMVGDIHIAEPGAMIGFAGRRVIEETVRETLPDDFQTAEYLLEHGMVDMVVKRQDMKETIARVLSMLMKKPQQKPEKSGNGNGRKNQKSGAAKANGKAGSAGAATRGIRSEMAKKKQEAAIRALEQVKVAQKAARRISKPKPQKNTAKKAAKGKG